MENLGEETKPQTGTGKETKEAMNKVGWARNELGGIEIVINDASDNTESKEETTSSRFDIIADKILNIADKLLRFLYPLSLLILLLSLSTQKVCVSGSSMYPTLNDGDVLTINKICGIMGYERYDIVVCKSDIKGGELIVKRIVGLPGETVKIDNEGKVYIDDMVLEDTYKLNYNCYTIPFGRDMSNGIKLGDDEYFVMGDNRVMSLDSRVAEVGNISKKDIVGRVIEDTSNPFMDGERVMKE